MLTACSGGGDSAEKSPLLQKVTHSDDGAFRGVDLGMNVDEVKKAEDASGLKDDEEDYLYYDFELGEEESFTVAYTFYDGALYSIELETYLDKPQQAADLFKDLKGYFDGKYGEGTLADDGFTVWKGKAPNGHNMEIAMMDDSEKYGYVEVLVTDQDY